MTPPGPRGLPYFGHTVQYLRDPLGFLEMTARDYGDIVGLRVQGRPAIVLHHPDDIGQVLATHGDRYTKGFPQQRAQSPFGKGLIVSDGALWQRQRRLVQPPLSRGAVLGHAGAMAACAAQFTAEWADGEVVAIDQAMTGLTRRLFIGALAGDLAGPALVQLEAALVAMADHFDAMLRTPVQIPLWVATPANRRFLAALRTLEVTTDALMAARAASAASAANAALRAPDGHAATQAAGQGSATAVAHADLFDGLRAMRDEHGQPMSPEQLRDEVKSLFLAGNETTALLLTYAWALLARHPQIADDLADEAAGLGDGPWSGADLARLPLAAAVVAETARLYPPIFLMAREAIAPDSLRDFPVAPGTLVVAAQWIVHRDPRWWDAPSEFRPARWLGGPPRGLPRFAYFPFGAGPRLCVGSHLALAEATIALAVIARRFRLQPIDAAPISLAPTMTLRPRHAIRLRVSRR